MKTTILATLLASVLTGPAALADSTGNPAYVGARTENPEKDTYAFRRPDRRGGRIAFIGPAHRVGMTTGEMEKDTRAYQPVTVEEIARAN